MEFSCSICNYTSWQKAHIQKHFNNKNSCNGVIVENRVDIYCEYCDRKYKTRPNLRKHLKTCKIKKDQEQDEKDKRIAELEAKLAKAEAKAGPQTVINNYIQVNVNGYRQTSLEHLTDNQYSHAIKRMIYSVPQMIENVHFDPRVPENHNIYISNIKNKYAMVYDGSKWRSKPQDQVIDQLINDQEYAIEDWLGEGDNFPKEMKKFNEYLEKKEQSSKSDEIKEVIREEVKLLLYNNRDVIKNKS